MGAAAKPKVGYTARPALLPAAASTLRKPALAAIGGVGTLLIVDLLTVYSCYRTGYELRAGLLARLPGLAPHGEMIGHEAYLFFVSIYLLVFGFAGLYHRRVSAVEESVIVLRACFYATVCALTLSSLAHTSQFYSRAVILIAAALTAFVAPAERFLMKSMLGRWPLWQRPVVLLGANANGLRAAQDMSADTTMGYKVAGVVTWHELAASVPWPVWTVSSREEAIRFCRERAVDSFILCEEVGDRAGLLDSFRLLENFAGEIKVAAADESLHALRIQSEVLRSSYLLSVENPLTRPLNLALKRALDLTVGTALCIFFLPVLIVIPLLILARSGPPVLFRHQRLGRNGRRFTCLKFRTMCVDADHRLRAILARDDGVRREFAATRKLHDDPRITPVGAWLRRTSLDELPQLWNVLCGQMSLVGPRPIVPEETGKYDVELTNYFRVPCGLTGLWQISGRNDVRYSERVRLDLFYIRNWSIWLDLVILARTALQVLRPRGAY